MKPRELVKKIEEAGLVAVRDLLSNLPGAEAVRVNPARNVKRHHQIDALLRVNYGGVSRLLAIEVKAQGAPRFARAAIYRLESCVAQMRQSASESSILSIIPMLISPYLSPEARTICNDHEVSYLDFEGNVRLVFDGVYIERSVPNKPKTETRALRSIFTPKAAAILRVLLREPERPWRVTDLAEEAKASLGHVSNVRRALLEREWADKRDVGVVLTQPDALLKVWRENHRRPGGRLVNGYTHLHGRPFDKLILTLLNPNPGAPRAIQSLGSAAQWFAPFGRDGTQSFYTDDDGAQLLGEALNLKAAGKGSNVVLHVTTDESLFNDASEPLPMQFCTNPIVTYLDLWCGNDREREAADHLAVEVFPWAK